MDTNDWLRQTLNTAPSNINFRNNAQNLHAHKPIKSVITIAKQAIFDKQQQIVGYELFNRANNTFTSNSKKNTFHSAESDAHFLMRLLSFSATNPFAGVQWVSINCTHASLLGSHLDLINPSRTTLEILPLPNASHVDIINSSKVLENLTSKGFNLAFNHSVLLSEYKPWRQFASFIKLDTRAKLPNETITSIIQLAKKTTKAKLIAEKIESKEHYELFSNLDVDMFQGYYLAEPESLELQLMTPTQNDLVRLNYLLRSYASDNAIIQLLKKSPLITLCLLRFIEFSGYAIDAQHSCSLKYILRNIGVRKLSKWSSHILDLLNSLPNTSNTSIQKNVNKITHSSIVRGYLMEQLVSEAMSAEEGELAYIIGLFSQLSALSQNDVSLEQILSSVALPEVALDAILHKKGALAPFLTLAKACENNDDESFAKIATNLHLSGDQVNKAHLNARIFASSVGSNMGA